MQDELLTVILITYNHRKYFRKCIDSALSQKTNFKFKIEVYDDASTDGTSDIVREYARKYPDKIIANINEKNKGSAENILQSLKNLNTKYFALCESDDYWCDDTKLQKQIDALEKNPDCSFSGHNTKQYNCSDGTYSPPFFNIKTKKIKLSKNFKWKDFIKVHISSRVCRTDCLDLNNLKNKLIATWDSTAFWYFLTKGNLYYIDEVMSIYNYTEEGIYSGASETKKKKMGLDNVIAINKELDYEYNFIFLDLFKRYIKLSLFDYIKAKYFLNKRELDNFYTEKSANLINSKQKIKKEKSMRIQFVQDIINILRGKKKIKLLEKSDLKVKYKNIKDIIKNNKVLKLHLGCGRQYKEGWINIDDNVLKNIKILDYKCNILKGLPFEDNSVDYIYHEHLMEHLTVEQGLNFTKECMRVLKKGGVLRIAMPDLEWCVKAYLNQNWKEDDKEFLRKFELDFVKTRAERLNLDFRCGHEWLYDKEELDRRLKEAGCENIVYCENRKSSHSELCNLETRDESILIAEVTK